MADIQERVPGMKSCTAPGPDLIHTYWLKKQTPLHECLAAQMTQLLMDGTHQELVTQGQIVLIMKNPQKGAIPSKYRPITCPCVTWKLQSDIIATKMNRHISQNMSRIQKGIANNTRVAKHQLLVDRAVTQDCKTGQTNLYTAWIDYKKAYYSVPRYMDIGMLGNVQHQQDNKSLHQDLNGAAENDSGGQLKAKCSIY